ncbi:MAG: hypothetical protein K9L74_05950 [Candidatus Izimaplasma sp.]|nr:hypothetical protein [Candidatus Izimaplasma bacterium]
MKNYNRDINNERMSQSKQRVMRSVMNKIHEEKPSFLEQIKAVFSSKLMTALSLSLGVLVLVFVVNFTIGTPADNTPRTLSAYESDRIAELSYISANLFTSTTELNNTSNLIRLNTTDTTSLEDNLDEFNTYFDMLKVFLNDDGLENSVTVETLEDSDYDYKLAFNVNDQPYEFYITIQEDDSIIGTLIINELSLDVTGKIESENTEEKIKLQAQNNNNYVSIEYKFEQDQEQETKKDFSIESNINGIISTKTIIITKDTSEQKIEILDNNNYYELKKEIENINEVFKLNYEVQGKRGQAVINELLDGEGNITYSYRIKEGNVEKEIETNRPNHSYNRSNEQDTDDNSSNIPADPNIPDVPENPGNNNNLPHNQDDDPGSSNKQSNTKNIIYQKKLV